MRFYLSGILVLGAFGVLASAQDDAEFQKFQQWMKTTGAESRAIQKADPKTGAEVAASAEKLANVYTEMHEYWSKRSAADAVKLSEEGKTAATELAAAAKAGDAEKAAAAYKAFGGTCRGCHDAHREKLADGSYKIK